MLGWVVMMEMLQCTHVENMCYVKGNDAGLTQVQQSDMNGFNVRH